MEKSKPNGQIKKSRCLFESPLKRVTGKPSRRKDFSEVVCEEDGKIDTLPTFLRWRFEKYVVALG